MKKVITMLALLGLLGNTASAELLKNFKHDGKIEIVSMVTKNAQTGNSDDRHTTSDTNARFQVNMSFDLNQDVEAIISAVKCNREYDSANAAEAPVGGAIDSFLFEQAYLNVKGVLGLDHKFGRQYYGNEGDLVLYAGTKSWPYQYSAGSFLSVSALEGWTSAYKYGKWDFSAVLAKVSEADAIATGDVDVDLAGLTAKYDLMENLKLGGYIYEQKTYDPGVGDKDKTLDVVGVKANGKFMGFDYNAEYAMNYGRKNAAQNYTGNAMIAGVKYDIELYGKFTFMGEFARGTGDDTTTADKDEAFTAIASDYRPGIFFAGVKANGIADLTTWNVGAKWHTPFADKLTITGKFYNFAPTEDKTGYDAYGNELDLCANWQHSETIGLKAYYAMMMWDKDYVDTNATLTDEGSSAFGAAISIKF